MGSAGGQPFFGKGCFIFTFVEGTGVKMKLLFRGISQQSRKRKKMLHLFP